MKIWHSRSALLACTALAVLYAVAPAGAQGEAAENSTILETIEVEGKKPAADASSNTPLATQTNVEEIAKKDIGNVKDLGNTTEPGIDYVETRPGAAGGTFIRGLGGPRIATVIDGIPIPYLETLTRTASLSPTTGISDSSNSFDFAALSAIDVLRGTDSSVIGSGGLAGGLLMRTLEPDDVIEAGRNWGTLSRLSYDSKDNSFSTSVAAAYRHDATSMLFQGSYKKGQETRNKGEDNIIGSFRTMPNPTDIDQSNLMFKLRHDIEGGHRIGMTAERFVLDSNIDLKTLQNGTTYRPGFYWGFDDTMRERLSLDYDYTAPEVGGMVDAAKLTLYWQRLTKDAGSNATRFASGAPGAVSWAYDRENLTRESAFGLSGGAVSSFDTGALSHMVRFGGNLNMFRYDQFITSIGGTSITSPPASQADVPNAEGTKLGLYIDDMIAFDNSAFTVTPGLRFDWHRYTPKLTDAFTDNTGYSRFGLAGPNDGTSFSPKLLVEYQATEQLGLFAQWSMAYRAPAISELYSNFSNINGGYSVLGNPDLKAETGQGFEAGANYDAGDLKGRVSVFHSTYRNFISPVEIFTSDYPAGYFPEYLITTWENIDRVGISGIEVRARKDFDNGFFVHGSLAYAYGKDLTNNAVLRTVAPLKSILGIGYDAENWGAELTGIFVGKMRDDHNKDTFDAPAYGIANVEAWWEPEQVEGLRLQAGVYNIFDKTYYNALQVRNIDPNIAFSTNQPLPFYSEPGRTFKLSLTHKF